MGMRHQNINKTIERLTTSAKIISSLDGKGQNASLMRKYILTKVLILGGI